MPLAIGEETLGIADALYLDVSETSVLGFGGGYASVHEGDAALLLAFGSYELDR